MSLLYQIPYKDPKAVFSLGGVIKDRIDKHPLFHKSIILCIGTDRCTGDALGPLVGMFLQPMRLPGIQVWGTLQNPVHALNLHHAIAKLEKQHKPLVIAVDACLGLPHHVGDIQIVDGPLKPGMGVKKVLPSVGDFHIKGIVNANGFLDTMALQNTRLHTVMEMAKTIADSLAHALKEGDS